MKKKIGHNLYKLTSILIEKIFFENKNFVEKFFFENKNFVEKILLKNFVEKFC